MKTEHKETAAKFLECLCAPQFTANAQNTFLFRGQYEASWPLIPSALRTGQVAPFGTEISDEGEQLKAEMKTLIRFFDAAYYAGLEIPGFASVKAELDQWRTRNWGSWGTIPQEFHAIAQHHGTPTRLIDWTLDPLVAAYFACRRPDGYRESREPGNVAVFIFDKTAIEKTKTWFLGETIFVPYHLNQNARAQRGVFTSYPPKDGDDFGRGPVKRQPLDELLPPESGSPITQLTLPQQQAPYVLRELHVKRIDGSTLFPGYYGASRAERERMTWENLA
jgi:hypothetical protein